MKRIFFAKILTLFFAFLLNISISSAQTSKCGTIFTPAQVAAERAAQLNSAEKAQFLPDKCIGKTLSITVHIINDSLGQPGITLADIDGQVQRLNANFAPICLSFQVCKVEYIDNYKYNRFLKPIEEQELLNLYYIPKTINIYFAQTVSVNPGSTVGGYAYFPGGPDFIIISKTSVGAVLHEMGHFFGLYHTFETQFGQELANGSNCVTAGDLICDTPADPGLSNTPAPDCNLAPGAQDPNGNWYVPHIGNTMSYYSSDCECGFTTQQLNRMANQFLNSRFYLW